MNHHGIQAHVGPMKPLSRGRVSIQSSDPFASPQIQFNYLSAEEDLAVMRRGIRLAEALLGERNFQSMGEHGHLNALAVMLNSMSGFGYMQKVLITRAGPVAWAKRRRLQ